ncbi:MAG: pseudaminic acid cytidylyltransferase [Burkholderiales bacterium]|nr:MAG: pseudaminic acid cytidylyltransferase [Burkholderiales bacterium]
MRLAVIPARGGSKRIPRKNVRPFAGKPIIAHSIEAARASGLFDHVVVSTDDREIAEVVRGFGAATPFVRPPELSDDHTGTNAVVRHAIGWFGEHGVLPEHVCCLYATAPFVQPHHLREGLDRLVASGRSFAFSVTSFAFPIQRALRIDADGCVQAIWPENIARRSQDLEETFHDAGQFYWGTARAFLDDVELFSSASVPVVLPRHLVQDIDTEEDWVRAELMFRALQTERADG